MSNFSQILWLSAFLALPTLLDSVLSAVTVIRNKMTLQYLVFRNDIRKPVRDIFWCSAYS